MYLFHQYIAKFHSELTVSNNLAIFIHFITERNGKTLKNEAYIHCKAGVTVRMRNFNISSCKIVSHMRKRY